MDKLIGHDPMFAAYSGNDNDVLSAYSPIPYKTKVTDNYGIWTGSSLKVVEEGTFIIQGMVALTSVVFKRILVYVNGSQFREAATIVTTSDTHIYQHIGEYVAGDVIDFRLTSGSNLLDSTNHYIKILRRK